MTRSTPLALLLLLTTFALPAPATEDVTALTQSALHTLDYVSVDYPGAVLDGQIANPAEYAEQVEFAARLAGVLGRLPAHPQRADLEAQAQALATAINARLPGAEIATRCRTLAADLIRTYGVAVAPRAVPDLARGAALYAQNCALCHGATGLGDGPAGTGLDPAPNNFHERERQALRSPYSLYSTITLGVDGTGMASYAHLPEADRWALAFHVAGWFATGEERARGATLAGTPQAAGVVPDMARLAQATPAEIEAAHGADGLAMLAHLRAHPQVLAGRAPAPLDTARTLLGESLATARAGDHAGAYEQAVAAYLEGFELAEPTLRATAADLVTRIETAMLAYRGAVQARAPAEELEAQVGTIEALLAQAEARASAGTLSAGMGFTSSFFILFREGLEAILVLAALYTFLVKTGRRDALRYLHAGWASAFVAGLATWVLVKYVIHASGASRELTEGVTALVAAAMLLWVGVWLHDHAHAARWQQYIRSQVEATMARGTLWSLTLIAFLAVYRELVETILFYEALWLQATTEGARGGIAGGLAVATAVLAAVGLGIFRASVRLPLGLFFRVNTAILFVLAFVFAGKGVAALQAAGTLDMSPIDFPTVDVLGLYPTLQGLGLQVLLVLLMAGYIALRYTQQRSDAT